MLKQRVGKGMGLQLDMNYAATLKFDHGKSFTRALYLHVSYSSYIMIVIATS